MTNNMISLKRLNWIFFKFLLALCALFLIFNTLISSINNKANIVNNQYFNSTLKSNHNSHKFVVIKSNTDDYQDSNYIYPIHNQKGRTINTFWYAVDENNIIYSLDEVTWSIKNINQSSFDFSSHCSIYSNLITNSVGIEWDNTLPLEENMFYLTCTLDTKSTHIETTFLINVSISNLSFTSSIPDDAKILIPINKKGSYDLNIQFYYEQIKVNNESVKLAIYNLQSNDDLQFISFSKDYKKLNYKQIKNKEEDDKTLIKLVFSYIDPYTHSTINLIKYLYLLYGHEYKITRTPKNNVIFASSNAYKENCLIGDFAIDQLPNDSSIQWSVQMDESHDFKCFFKQNKMYVSFHTKNLKRMNYINFYITAIFIDKNSGIRYDRSTKIVICFMSYIIILIPVCIGASLILIAILTIIYIFILRKKIMKRNREENYEN